MSINSYFPSLKTIAAFYIAEKITEKEAVPEENNNPRYQYPNPHYQYSKEYLASQNQQRSEVPDFALKNIQDISEIVAQRLMPNAVDEAIIPVSMFLDIIYPNEHLLISAVKINGLEAIKYLLFRNEHKQRYVLTMDVLHKAAIEAKSYEAYSLLQLFLPLDQRGKTEVDWCEFHEECLQDKKDAEERERYEREEECYRATHPWW